MINAPVLEIQIWPIDRLIFYARNPRKNDAAVDRMCSSIREFGFKVPVLARSDGEVVDGHLRLKAARKLGSWPGGDTTGIPVIFCDEWSEAQVKAFRLLVNRSVTWADWDEELLALELQELNEAVFDLSLTGFNPGEIDGLLAIPDEERTNAAPPLPDKAYREARRAAFGQAIARLQQGTSAAATTLFKTMIDSNTPASVRVRAAECVMNHATKAIEIEAMRTIVRRLRRLEGRFAPHVDDEGRTLADVIRERRRRRLEASGQPPFEEGPPVPLTDDRGRPLLVGEILIAGRNRARERNR
jgi:hypothetical protein